MKRTLLITALLAGQFSQVTAATYTELTSAWCDETNNVIYNGRGYFAVESAANTAIDITISLSSLNSYVNSNDYAGSSYMLLWENSIQNYGLGDNADTSLNTGSRTPYLSGYTTSAWNAADNNISYDTLSNYAVGDYVTLSITNSTSNGVNVTATNSQGETETLYTAPSLRYSSMNAVSGYYVNLNYVTGVNLHTPSTLNTATYVPPVDYSAPFVSQRTDGTTVGRVTFLGDSITHGVNDQSYRWQLFKTLTDNGIENEIAGPREGYYSAPGHTQDAGSTYGGEAFANVHLAQASGRTHNIISGSNAGMTGVNYGGHSTASTAANYDSNTWFCMMGTNDMLSDGGSSTTDYCNKMAKMLGGTVSYAEGTGYTWTADNSNWGTMGTIVNDVHGEGDTFYMLSITPWTQHANSNTESFHYGAQEFNKNLELWTAAYNKAHTGKNVVYVDVTRGMIDKTSDVSFYSPGAFFNTPGSDGLHPNDQGSIIIAGNLARAMGIGGRTAGLQRQNATGWSSAPVNTLAAGSSQLWAANAFTMENGYTIDLNASFGDGAQNGWATTDTRLAISLGDGTNSGTLNVSEGYISWGSDVLFCWDNSTLANEGNLRIAWHNGNTTDNVLQGYYVWLGDMLIGQGLEATTDTGLNGILLSAYGADAALNTLSWSNTAYAPSTTGISSTEHAFITTQDTAAISTLIPNKAYTTAGVDFASAAATNATAGQVLVNTATPENNTFKIESGAGWTGMTNTTYTEDINVQVTGSTTHTVFGAMNNAKAGQLTLEIADGAIIGNGTYNGQTAAIAGSYGGGQAEAFNVYVEGGTVNGDIVGGAVNGSGHIDSVKIVVNNGTIQGGIYGGSKTSGSVDNAHIIINGGIIKNGINAGGSAGAVTHAQITITGGVVTGDITKGNAQNADVIIQGSDANITGGVEADSLTLYNVQKNMAASVKSVKEITTAGNTNTAIAVENGIELDTLHLNNGTTLSVLNTTDSAEIAIAAEATITLTELIVGAGATLNANIIFAEEAFLRMEGALAMGSDITLTTGMTLDLADHMLTDLYNGEYVTLFTGVDRLTLNSVELDNNSVTDVTGIFNGLRTDDTYYLSYNNGDVSLFAGSYVPGPQSIPEPTTTTLSLLALAGLAARRRRR
ncbi:MAG: hypothetical protein IJB64_02630 [Akkermansia sp.]|nr:hypothetical protein [Akkermansia sp.]